jgi:flagellar basal-body rod modification protein FlgD
MATSAIFHHALIAGQAQAAQAATPFGTTTPATGGASAADDSTTSSGSATISANDFLTLLVTEMKNQDPTANTDPNEYINQLVQVNSLEQLIDINQTLSGDVSGSASSTPANSSDTNATPATSGANAAVENQAAQAAPGLSPAAWSNISQTVQAMRIGGGPSLGSTGISPSGLPTAHEKTAPIAGNLVLQKTSPAAARVGHALAGRTHAAPFTANPAAK